MLRRDFLKLVPLTGLALLLWPERALVQAQEPAPEPPAEAQAWGFPLAFPAYFPESEPEPQTPTPTYDYYLNVIRKTNG